MEVNGDRVAFAASTYWSTEELQTFFNYAWFTLYDFAPSQIKDVQSWERWSIVEEQRWSKDEFT